MLMIIQYECVYIYIYMIDYKIIVPYSKNIYIYIIVYASGTSGGIGCRPPSYVFMCVVVCCCLDYCWCYYILFYCMFIVRLGHQEVSGTDRLLCYVI